MNNYPNLPHHQRFLQLLVDRFNADGTQWRERELRRLQRKLNALLPEEACRIIDLLESSRVRDSEMQTSLMDQTVVSIL